MLASPDFLGGRSRQHHDHQEYAHRHQQHIQELKRRGVVIVVMGVSGAGKTTVGSLLARELSWDFADADDFHSVANIEKMRAGIPLTDADRAPWLERLRALVTRWIAEKKNAVLACSALKRSYRDVLKVDENVQFVYLKGDRDLFSQRLLERHHHYMKQEMLDSQLLTLEPPVDAIAVNANATPESIVSEIRRQLDLI
jgi:gluconokinase